MRECILHIGTEKTGSTTLQHFLSLNRSKLIKNGIGYTKSLGKTANNGICVLSYPLDRRDHLTEDLKIKSDTALKNKQDAFKRKIKQEINFLAQRKVISKFIISSELIQSRLTSEDDLSRLKSFLIDDLGFETIRVIVYLRDPALTAQSLFSTAVKFGHSWERPPLPQDSYFGNICDHKATLERFSAVFGNDSIVPRLFQKDDLVGNSIITDFFETIEEPIASGYSIPENSNSSLSYTALMLLREINKHWPRKIGDYPNFKRRDFIKYLEKYSGSKYQISSDLATEYRDYFNISNEWVRLNYFPHKENLFQKKEEKENIDQIDALNTEEINGHLMRLWDERNSVFLFNEMKLFARKIKFKLTSL